MTYVIGLDLGDRYSYASTVEGMDERRSGGTELGSQVGVPSRFFYDGDVSGDPLVCRELDRYDIDETAGVGMLKRHINESFEMGGGTFAYRDAVTRVAQHVVRMANESLLELRQATTGLVLLAYPATFSSADRRALVGAVEGATLEDGRHVEVVGTIIEPAAAALEYLARRDPGGGARTVLVYDLGGGTFDATALTAYPEGEKGPGRARYFYREHLTEGIADLGGEDFSAALRSIVERAIDESGEGHPSGQGYRIELERVTREAKHALSTAESFRPSVVGIRARRHARGVRKGDVRPAAKDRRGGHGDARPSLRVALPRDDRPHRGGQQDAHGQARVRRGARALRLRRRGHRLLPPERRDLLRCLSLRRDGIGIQRDPIPAFAKKRKVVSTSCGTPPVCPSTSLKQDAASLPGYPLEKPPQPH